MIVSPVAGRENRKPDWPWRKRAEQKPHAEFSVGRSSIIGARYRPVTRQARQAGTPARCVRLSLTFTLLCRHDAERRAASRLQVFHPRATSLISPTDAIFTLAAWPLITVDTTPAEPAIMRH